MENIVAKGEFVFKKPSAAEASESVYMNKRVKSFNNMKENHQKNIPVKFGYYRYIGLEDEI